MSILMLTKRGWCDRITVAIAELCNGSTADSDSVCEGSSPSSAASGQCPLPYALSCQKSIREDSRGGHFMHAQAKVYPAKQTTCANNAGSLIGVWLSLVERLVRDQEAVCSNHITPTTKKERFYREIKAFLFRMMFALVGQMMLLRNDVVISNDVCCGT